MLAMRPAVSVDRLTGPALSNFVPEKRGWPADIGVIAVLDGARLFDGAGRLRITDVRDRIAGRLHLTPRLRQVVYRPPPGLGGPLWVDAPSFDITDHVHVHPLPASAGEAELLQSCEELRRRSLDPSRPLWQLWLLPGLADGQVGMFIKLHHVIADGVAGVALLGNLLDHTADAASPAAPPWTARPAPAARDLLLDNLRRYADALARSASHLNHPAGTTGRFHRTWASVRELLTEPRAPRTSLNRPIGATRRIAVVRCSLHAVHDAAHRADARVNDAVLAAVTGGLRDLLQSRRENVAGLVLHAMVPVALHDPSLGPAQGNRYGVMVVSLPVGEPNAARRLQTIAAQTTRRKKQPRRPWGTGLLGSPLVQRVAVRLASRQHFINIHVANVPGPATPLYLAGARLTEAFPVTPLSGNLTLGIGVISYTDQLTISVIADRDTSPDLPTFIAGLTNCLFELTGATVAGTPASHPRDWPG
jgi:diacylglycerol O-acyltransferase